MTEKQRPQFPAKTPAELVDAEAQRITAEFQALTEPNSPNKTHFMVKLSDEFIWANGKRDKLIAALPYKNLSLSMLNDRKGIFVFTPTKEIKTSFRAKMQEAVRKSAEAAAGKPTSTPPEKGEKR